MSSDRSSTIGIPNDGRAGVRHLPPIDLSLGAIIALVTGAVAAGSGLAWIAGTFSGLDRPAYAAGLGALGAIGAALVAAIGVSALKRTAAARDEELLRAANPTHPLMRRLMAEAPGTYVHSVATANLAEAAAEAVGADALVARVGAYYHDIGKLRRPGFFFENQEDDENPHAGADPADSADIIMSHVTDGLVLADEYGLPERVLGVIRQHHGTSLVRYFYHQASASGATVYESDFRYPGEPPRSKEAAIVMLADASEASVRAMTHPDTAEIGRGLTAVFDDRRRDGQLELSGLTEGDLESIRGVFVKQLVGFRHVRCPYPCQTLPTEGTPDADQCPESSRS